MIIIRYIVVFISLLFFNGLYSQVPSYQWSNKVKDFSSLWNSITDIKTDASGSVYVCGRFSGLKDFDPGPGVFNLATPWPGSNSDIFILKLDSLGDFIWVKQIGGNSGELCGTMALDGAGNIFLSGLFMQTVDFDPGPGTYTMSSSSWNGFVIKLDPNGNLVFAKQFPANMTSIDVTLDPNGNLLITGSFGAGDFDPGAGVYNMYEISNGDAFILKLDPNGNFLWARAVGGPLADEGCYIRSDSFGNVFIAGHFGGTCSFGSTANNLISGGGTDIFILKLNSSGNFQWVKRVGGIDQDGIRSLEIDTVGSLFLAGFFAYSCDMDPGPGVTTFTAPLANTFVLKLDSAGNHLWSKQFGDSTLNRPRDLLLDQNGNVYTIGFFSGFGDFDPGPGSDILNSIVNGNTFISKLDNSGNNLWVGSIGDSAYAEGMAITMSNNQNMYITGFFYGTADLNPGILVDTLNSEGPNVNMFVAGYGKCIQPMAPALNVSKLKLCGSGTTTISVAGTGTVNWYSTQYSNTSIDAGNNFITPQLTVNTTFYADNNTTCAKSLSRTAITITVNPLPTINVSSNDTIICEGESVTLNATGANSYTWGPNLNSNIFVVSPSFQDSLPYSYSVLGTDTNECVNVGTAQVYVQLCLGTDRLGTRDIHLKIYPVPCQGIFSIETGVPSAGKSSEINIVNTLGQVVKKEEIIVGGQTATIDASDLPSGVYYISLYSSGSKITNKKILIIH